MAAMCVAALIKNRPFIEFPASTVVGALTKYLETPNADFQPMNANFGLLPPPEENIRDKNAKKLFLSEKSLKDLKKAEF